MLAISLCQWRVGFNTVSFLRMFFFQNSFEVLFNLFPKFKVTWFQNVLHGCISFKCYTKIFIPFPRLFYFYVSFRTFLKKTFSCWIKHHKPSSFRCNSVLSQSTSKTLSSAFVIKISWELTWNLLLSILKPYIKCDPLSPCSFNLLNVCPFLLHDKKNCNWKIP